VIGVQRTRFILLPPLAALVAGGVVSCTFKTEQSAPGVTQSVVSAPKTATNQSRATAIDLPDALIFLEEDRALIFDVRPGFVYGFGHIVGAVSWPKNSFAQGLPSHEPSIRQAIASGKTVILYCTDAACPDARTVADQLVLRGHSVSVLKGGYHAWKEAGMPIE
jgi:rhodanese-related sulfurtransferase